MNKTNETPFSAYPPVTRPVDSDEKRQVIDLDGTIVRVDAEALETTPDPHVTAPPAGSDSSHWQPTVETVDLGLQDVFENNAALQQAAEEMSGSVVTSWQNQRPLQIEAAWEVEAFRWPKITNRLLEIYPHLFDQIGYGMLSELQPTRSRIGICSAHRREGKSTVAICLARWAAENGKRTLLIDADVENPQLTVMSGMNPHVSWKHAVDLDFPLSEVLIQSADNGLTVMPARIEQRPNIGDKSLKQLSALVFQLKYEFDVVIIDVGTVENICVHGGEGIDLVDAMLIVRNAAQTSNGQLIEARQVLRNLGMNKTAVTENFSRTLVNSISI